MSDDPTLSRERKIPSILAGVVLCLLLLLAIASLGSYRDLTAARERQQQLQQRIEDTRLRNQQLRQRIERLENDPSSLERVAREQYKMQRPDDVVIIFPQADEASVEREKRP